jgi:hypothetical protein
MSIMHGKWRGRAAVSSVTHVTGRLTADHDFSPNGQKLLMTLIGSPATRFGDSVIREKRSC